MYYALTIHALCTTTRKMTEIWHDVNQKKNEINVHFGIELKAMVENTLLINA